MTTDLDPIPSVRCVKICTAVQAPGVLISTADYMKNTHRTRLFLIVVQNMPPSLELQAHTQIPFCQKIIKWTPLTKVTLQSFFSWRRNFFKKHKCTGCFFQLPLPLNLLSFGR